ncbi:MAG: PD-(D/E)XK nuclease family transposase, partial [Sulfuricurvum sp.]
MNFLDVRTDYAFKKVFGSEESKDILISFLNALIYFESDVKIKDLTIVD